jgi:hypothetical protein
MIKLINILKEALLKETTLSSHYKERRIQRAEILDIILPKESYEGYNLNEIKPLIIAKLQEKLLKQLESLEKDNILASTNNNVGYVIFSPKLKFKSNIFPIKIKTSSTAANTDIEKSNIGNNYIVVIKDNTLITLLLVDNSDLKSFKKQMIDHDTIKGSINNKDYIILKNTNADYTIDLDELMGNAPAPQDTKIDEKDLPYKVKTDYRVGSKFTHKDFGTGTIVNTSSGTKGTANPKGMLDWIEVDFGKPYVFNKKLMTSRRINDIYTTIYFDKQLKVA